MVYSVDNWFFPTLYIASTLVCVGSATVFLHPRTPIRFVWFHMACLALPLATAIFAVCMYHPSTNISGNAAVLGPWRSDRLAWLMVMFVSGMSWIVQRFSVRYLHGDRAYRKYFFVLTFLAATISLTWLADDLRLLLLCWAVALSTVNILFRLNSSWTVVVVAAKRAWNYFALSWLALAIATVWFWTQTHSWHLRVLMSQHANTLLPKGAQTGIDLLLVLAAIIPAAQWPFQRWLFDSIAVPTPVSAVMHAGFVNAGGILLTYFAPAFRSTVAHSVLLLVGSVSVLMGTGILRVQVDYKRQLVASTMAQMGFMFMQCALGAYTAAVIHLMLHGIFKATLFLQSGSVIPRNQTHAATHIDHTSVSAWGVFIGIASGVGYWWLSPGLSDRMLSAVVLAGAISVAWAHMNTVSQRNLHRFTGALIIGGAAVMYAVVQTGLDGWLRESVPMSIPVYPSLSIVAFVILMLGVTVGLWGSRRPKSRWFLSIYLWLVHLGEPSLDVVESHPRYLQGDIR